MAEGIPSEASRLPYHAPTLREHGTVQELTLASGMSGPDFDGAGYDSQDATPQTS